MLIFSRLFCIFAIQRQPSEGNLIQLTIVYILNTPDNMKLITRAICAAAICAVATATLTLCVGKNTDIEGRWVQPVPGQPDAWQGIALEPDGKASSINMATLAYDTWTIEGNRLILGGKSIGNGQTIDFSDTLVVVRLSADTMVLRMGAMDLEYTREKCQ